MTSCPMTIAAGCRADAATEAERALRMVDAAVRELAPMDLHRRGRTADAEALQRLDPVVDAGTLDSAAAWARAVMPEHRPLQWLLRRAASGDAAVAWVAAVVLVAEPLGVRGLSELIRSVTATLATPRRAVAAQRSPS